MKKKKLISILLVVAMMFSIMPTAVFADTSDDLYVGGVQVTDANKDNIVKAINDAANDTVASGTATYDPDSNTLTLDKFSYTGEGYKYDNYSSAAIYAQNDLIFNLVGSNTLNCTDVGIRAAGLTIQGNDKETDTLTVTSRSNNIHVRHLTISNATITANDMSATGNLSITGSIVNTDNDVSGWISAYETLCVTSSTINFKNDNALLGAKVKITESTITTADGESSFIESESSLEIIDSEVTVANVDYPAISAADKLSILNGSKVKATTTSDDSSFRASAVAGAIMLQQITNTNCTVEVQDSELEANGAFCGILTFNGVTIKGNSTVTANGNVMSIGQFNMVDEIIAPSTPNFDGNFDVIAGADAENTAEKDASSDTTYENKYVRIEPAATTYTVEHWQQNTSGNGYTLYESETLHGTTNAETVAEAKNYPGFTAQTFTQTTILPDGTAVVKIKYDRNTYTVTATATEGGTVTGGGTYDYGETVTLTATTSSGYDFVNWTKGGEVVSTTSTWTFTATENGTYVANFELSASDDENGTPGTTQPPSYDYPIYIPSTTPKDEPKEPSKLDAVTACHGDASCPMSGYTDIDTDAWYHDGVHYCIENGIMGGYGNGIFRPNTVVSRAMISAILWNLEGNPVVNYALQYKDVPSDAWYTEAVRWMVAEDLASGYGNGIYAPEDSLTREQLAAILRNYAIYKGYDVSVGANTNIQSYEDAVAVSDWAYASMQWICGSGIVGGMPGPSGNVILAPSGQATRAQVATMMMTFCEMDTE